MSVQDWSPLRPVVSRIRHAVALAGLWFLLTSAAMAQEKVIPVWPGDAPGSEGWTQKEVETRNDKGVVTGVRNVTKPTLTVYLPDRARANGTAVIVCPGGGFRFLSWENEGTKVAEWLQARGVAAFLLKYRLRETPASEEEYRKQASAPRRPPAETAKKEESKSDDASRKAAREEGRKIAELAADDGRQAIKLVREHASEWGIQPNRIGIMGFSAGGMLTMGVVMKHDAESRPDFAVPIYGGNTGDAKVAADAPPLFIVCASDDRMMATSSARLYLDWKAADRPVELHLYEKGGHGFGMRSRGLPVDHWIDRLGDWLDERGLLKPASTQAR